MPFPSLGSQVYVPPCCHEIPFHVTVQSPVHVYDSSLLASLASLAASELSPPSSLLTALSSLESLGASLLALLW